MDKETRVRAGKAERNEFGQYRQQREAKELAWEGLGYSTLLGEKAKQQEWSSFI